MESTDKFMWVLVSSSLWLTGSGLVLWLGLRSRLRLSPGTRAAASMLVVLQGWIWIGIPVELDLAWLRSKPTAAPPLKATPSDAIPVQTSVPGVMGLTSSVELMTGTEPHSVSRAPFGSTQRPGSGSIKNSAEPVVSSAVIGSRPVGGSVAVTGWVLVTTIRTVLDALPMLLVAAWAIWMAGIAILLWRSICGFLALSRTVQKLPRASVQWQHELAELCRDLRMASTPVLRTSNVAAPMLVQTLEETCIVVPAWLWQSCTADQRTSILLHELAHYRRGDLWRQLAMRLLVLPHWFNPVAWWAVRQFEAASEVACDAVACGGDPRVAISYSKALLVLNETILNERLRFRYSQALAISGGSLTERIRRILQPEFQKESQMSRFLILSAMTVLAGLATIRIQAADDAPSSDKESAEIEPANTPGQSLRRRTIIEEVNDTEPAKATAGSLLANGGFEKSQDESDDPEAWFGTRIPQTAGHFLLASSSVAHGGKRSVVVEIGDNHPAMRVDYNWTAVAKGWKAGESYELSGWIKTENVKFPAVIMVQFWSDESMQAKMVGAATTQFTSPVKGTTDWTKVSTRFVVPKGTGAVRIRAALSSQENPGAKAWFDDLSFVTVSRSEKGLIVPRSASESIKIESAGNETARAPGASLLANGGFERVQQNSSDPDAWFGTRVPQTAGHFVLASSSVAHRGKRSVAVEIGDSHPDRRVAYNWAADAKGWKAGETYELSGWLKTENVKQPAFIMAQFWNEEGTNKKIIGGATTQFSNPVQGTTDWTRVSTRLKVPEGTAIVRIRAGLSSQDNRGAKAWLDDISLVKVAD